MFEDINISSFQLKEEEEWKLNYKLMKEYEMLGFYLSGHPLEEYKENYKPSLLKEFNEVKENEDLHNKKDILLGYFIIKEREKDQLREIHMHS